MQVARLRFGLVTRTPRGKLVQILRALQLELFYTKREILEAYLNFAPYGSNVEGVAAASLIWFGKPVSRLGLAEALTLAVLPKSPAATAINYVLNQWQALNVYTTDGDLHIDNNVSERTLKLIGIGRGNLPQLHPLAEKIVAEPLGSGVFQQAFDLGTEHAWLMQCAGGSQLDQLAIGHRVPEEIRQPRCQIEFTDQVSCAGFGVGRIEFSAEQEMRGNQDAVQRCLDAVFENRLVFGGSVVELENRFELGVGHRPAERLAGKAAHDFLGSVAGC